MTLSLLLILKPQRRGVVKSASEIMTPSMRADSAELMQIEQQILIMQAKQN